MYHENWWRMFIYKNFVCDLYYSRRKAMFTGSPSNGSVGTSVGYVVVMSPEKRSLVLTFLNPETLIWDMIGVTALTDPLVASVSAHLNGSSPFSLVAILGTQLTWQARKTPSKGVIVTPASRLQINASHPIFAPLCSLTEEVPLLHYVRLDIPSRMVFKDAPTGKYVTFYGTGFSAMNAWVSDIMPEATILAASGMSAIMTCIAIQRAGLLLRSTSGTALVVDPDSRLPRGLIVGNVGGVAAMNGTGPMAGFEDFMMASSGLPLASNATPPRPKLFAAGVPPTPPSNACTPHKFGEELAFPLVTQSTRVTPTISVFMLRPPPVTAKIPFICALENPSVACYMCVTLQLLSACENFQQRARLCAPTAQVTNVMTLGDLVYKIVNEMYNTTQRCIPLTELLKQTGLVGQHDAREFIEMLLNNMNDPFVTKLFQVETTCNVHCLDCGNVTVRQDVQKIINVPLGNGNLQELLNVSFRGETLTGENKYVCIKCGVKTDARAFTTISNTPETVILVLQRYTNMQTKIMTNVMAPSILHLPNNHDVTYNLKAIIAHCGNHPQSGHYVVSHVTRDGVWRTFDDATVYAGSWEVLHDPSITPYIFMYSRPALLDYDDHEDDRANFHSPKVSQAAHEPNVLPATWSEGGAETVAEEVKAEGVLAGPPKAPTKQKKSQENDERADEERVSKKPKCAIPEVPGPKAWADIVKDHDVECLQDKFVMVMMKGSRKGTEEATRVTVLGGGLTQLRVKTIDGVIRKVTWSALIGFATD